MFRKVLVFGGIAAVLIAAVITLIFVYNKKPEIVVPQSFLDARAKGAEIAIDINQFAESVIGDLDNIAKKDAEADYTAALDLTIAETAKARNAKEKSFELLQELQKMVVSLEGISDEESRQLAMQAASTEVALVGKLIEYNDDINRLLDNLRYKFVSYDPAKYNEQTEAITKEMNDKALQINEMSRKYQTFMREFDERVER